MEYDVEYDGITMWKEEETEDTHFLNSKHATNLQQLKQCGINIKTRKWGSLKQTVLGLLMEMSHYLIPHAK